MRPERGKVLTARKWLFLGALVSLAGPATGDATGADLPSQPCPALSAAPLVYALVLDPIGSRTWAERQIQEIRVGARDHVRENPGPLESFILLALHTQLSVAYALEMMEAPPEAAPREGSDSPRAFTPPAGLQRAFEAMGLTPQDLIKAPDMPPVVFSLASALLGVLDWGLGLGSDVRARVRGVPTLRLDPEQREPAPHYLRFKKPPPPPENPPLRFSKKIVRSIYKILLGVAIGILIWGLVRRDA
jgi:hypothetical protein